MVHPIFNYLIPHRDLFAYPLTLYLKSLGKLGDY